VPQKPETAPCHPTVILLARYHDPVFRPIILSGGTPMNRLLVMLVLVVLGSALPGGAVADDQRGSTTGVTQLILLFFSNASRGFLPKRVVADDKDWKIVKDA
jgi:hypothetical protein